MTSSVPPVPLAVGCTRVSTLQQDDNYGQATQAEEIRQEAARRGWTLLDTVYEVESGAKEERVTVARYYALAEQHPGLHFIFPRVDRIGRRAHLILGIVSELHKRGATVHTVGIPMSLRSKEGMLMLTMLSGVAEFDYSGITERLHSGKYAKAAQNRWPHGAAPYGYRIVRDERGKSVTLERDPETGPVVERIFRQALAGEGSGAIAVALTQAGIPSPRAHKGGGHWTHRAVLYTLANAAYTGRREFRGASGELAIVTFPPFVTPGEFQNVRGQVEGRRQHRPARTTRPALFAGHLRCGLCGGAMNLRVSKRQGYDAYLYYRCLHTYAGENHSLIRGGRACHNHKGWRVGETDELGWSLFCAAMTDPAFLAQAAGRAPADQPDHSARMAELRGQMAQVTLRAVTHDLPAEVLDLALAPLRDELARLERDAATVPLMETPDMRELASALAGYLPGLVTLEERRRELGAWKARLVLHPERELVLEVTVMQG